METKKPENTKYISDSDDDEYEYDFDKNDDNVEKLEVKVYNGLKKEEIEKIQNKIREKNRFKVVKPNTLNVLLLGLKRSGRTTIIELMQDPMYEPLDISLFSETLTTVTRDLSIRKKDEKEGKEVLFVDTPGPQSLKNDELEKIIMKVLSDCMEANVSYFNLVLICIDPNRARNSDTREFVGLVKKIFGNEIPIAIAFTHADQELLKKKKKNVKRSEIKEYLASSFNLPLYDIGAIQKKNYKKKEQEKAFNHYKQIYGYRAKLLEFILNQDLKKKIEFTDVRCFKKFQDDVGKVFKEVCNDYESLINEQLFLNEEIKKGIKSNNDYIKRHQGLINNLKCFEEQKKVYETKISKLKMKKKFEKTELKEIVGVL